MSLCQFLMKWFDQRYWHCPCSIWSRVYKTVQCLSVCLSVHPSVHSREPTAAGLLLWAQQGGDISQLLQLRRANAGSATLSAYVGIVTEHTDLFICCKCR